MKKGEITIAEAVKTKGYTTGHFGKWHVGTLTTKMKDANRAREFVSSLGAHGVRIVDEKGGSDA